MTKTKRKIHTQCPANDVYVRKRFDKPKAIAPNAYVIFTKTCNSFQKGVGQVFPYWRIRGNLVTAYAGKPMKLIQTLSKQYKFHHRQYAKKKKINKIWNEIQSSKKIIDGVPLICSISATRLESETQMICAARKISTWVISPAFSCHFMCFCCAHRAMESQGKNIEILQFSTLSVLVERSTDSEIHSQKQIVVFWVLFSVFFPFSIRFVQISLDTLSSFSFSLMWITLIFVFFFSLFTSFRQYEKPGVLFRYWDCVQQT